MSHIVIAGEGIGAALAACCAAAWRPGAAIDLHLGPGGASGLEPVVLDGLPAPILAALDPLVVRTWDAFTVVCGGAQRQFPARLALIDPRQVALEIDRLAGRIRLCPPSGAGAPDLVITVPPGQPVRASMLSADSAAGLSRPVLADFDVARASDLFLQYFPDAGGAVTVRQCCAAAIDGPALLAAHDDGPALAAAILEASAAGQWAIKQVNDFINLHE